MEMVIQRFALDGYTLLESSEASLTSQTSTLTDKSSGDESKAVSFPLAKEKPPGVSPSPHAGDAKSSLVDQRVRSRRNKKRSRQGKSVSVEVSSSSQEEVEALGRGRRYCIDKVVPAVLVFPTGTCLQNHPLYLSGEIFLQDKV